MTFEQLKKELRQVAPADFSEWRMLRAPHIAQLTADEKTALVASRFPEDEELQARPLMERSDAIAMSSVNAAIELMDEKYMDAPEGEGTQAHADIRELIGIYRGFAAAVLALSRPIIVQSGK